MVPGEKREHARVTVNYPARVEVEGAGAFDAVIENVGSMGALLASSDIEVPMESGTFVQLVIAMGALGEVRVRGEVVRSDQELAGADIRRIFAVRFDTPISH